MPRPITASGLVSKGYTSAEKAVGSNYAPGDVVAFHRPYKRLGVEKGDERRVAGVDHRRRTVHLEGPDGKTVAWKPSQVGARKGGTEVYRRQPGDIGVGQTPPLRGHRLTLESSADGADRLAHHGVGQMDVFQCSCRIAVTEQAADGQHRLALRQGHAGMGMSKIMKADIVQVRFCSYAIPD